MSDSCRFCKVVEGEASDGFKELFRDHQPVCEVVATTADFIVILDVAPIVTGHLLVITRLHQQSFAEYWHEDSRRLKRVIDALLSAAREGTSGSVIICEHGLGFGAIGQAGCIDHAHLHVIPTHGPLASSFIKTGVKLEAIQDVGSQLHKAGNQQYIYLLDSDDREYLAIYPRFPSQLVRMIVAQHQGVKLWNWTTYVDSAEKLSTRERILEALGIYDQLARKIAPY